MAKIISVIVSGNPDSNSGFNKLVLFNNPNFDIEDKIYVGFEGCPHFYTIKATPTHMIFKLVKNNVRSHGAVRPGSLAIAFSIPKNHKLDNGYTPYDVLEDLKKVFLAKCMTCKDPVRETYEFNSPFVDQTVLDQTAAKYTISPIQLPDRVMKTNAPVGFVVKPEAEIIAMFRDFYYSEFENFSEVIVADTVNQTSYVEIPNLPVPRIKVYSVYVDGVFQDSVSSEDKQITVLSPKSPEYYDCKPLNFTIRQLKDNGIIGVELLDSQERINVSTEGLATPRKVQYQIKFASNEINKYFQDHSNLVEVVGMKGLVPIKNLTFTLTGENNVEVKLGTISVRIQSGSKYTLNTFRFEGNMLKVMVDEKKVYHTNTIAGGGGRTPEANSPVYEVKIQLNERFRFGNDKNTLRIKLKGAGEILSSSQIRFAYNNKEKLFEGTFLIPKASVSRVSNPCLCFSTKTHEYSYNIVNLLKGDQCIVSERHFKVQKIGFFTRFQKPLLLMCALFATLLLGGLLGYTTAGGFREQPAPNPKDTTENVSEADASVETMTEEDVKEFLQKADGKLKEENVNFAGVNNLHDYYTKNKGYLDEIDRNFFEGKVCNRIEDYHELVDNIENKNIEGIKKIKEQLDSDGFHIWVIHHKVVNSILENENKFKNTTFNPTCFTDVLKECSKVNQTCTRCLQKVDNLNEHIKTCRKYACHKCGAGMNFNTEGELKNHMKTKHGVGSSSGNNSGAPQTIEQQANTEL